MDPPKYQDNELPPAYRPRRFQSWGYQEIDDVYVSRIREEVEGMTRVSHCFIL